jgi:hypothetical protein
MNPSENLDGNLVEITVTDKFGEVLLLTAMFMPDILSSHSPLYTSALAPFAKESFSVLTTWPFKSCAAISLSQHKVVGDVLSTVIHPRYPLIDKEKT